MLEPLAGLVFIILGLVLALFGVKLAKLLVSLTFGLATGYLFYAYSSPGLKATIGQPALFILGFVIGALIGFSVFKLAISLLAGFLSAYSLATSGIIAHSEEALALLSLAFAAVIYYLAEKLLAAAFALAGAGLVYLGLLSLGLGGWIPLGAALIVLIAGLVRKR